MGMVAKMEEVAVRSRDIIEIKDLSHSYGSKMIYKNLNLTIEEGSIYGVLGKNGVGKSTLINILMGFLVPKGGECLIYTEKSSSLSNATKEKIALLHEGFITYDYMSIEQIEGFFSPFYKNWDRGVFYELVDLMKLNPSQKISTLSCGQKSQVVLGTIFAQNAELLILDDYSMGLDAGYRRLFVDYLRDYVEDRKKTVLITSHVMGDLVGLIDKMAIVQRGGKVHQSTMNDFVRDFKCYKVNKDQNYDESKVHRVQEQKLSKLLFTFENFDEFELVECDFEDKFLGFVGRY